VAMMVHGAVSIDQNPPGRFICGVTFSRNGTPVQQYTLSMHTTQQCTSHNTRCRLYGHVAAAAAGQLLPHSFVHAGV
jgi:hypothetical protein